MCNSSKEQKVTYTPTTRRYSPTTTGYGEALIPLFKNFFFISYTENTVNTFCLTPRRPPPVAGGPRRLLGRSFRRVAVRITKLNIIISRKKIAFPRVQLISTSLSVALFFFFLSFFPSSSFYFNDRFFANVQSYIYGVRSINFYALQNPQTSMTLFTFCTYYPSAYVRTYVHS